MIPFVVSDELFFVKVAITCPHCGTGMEVTPVDQMDDVLLQKYDCPTCGKRYEGSGQRLDYVGDQRWKLTAPKLSERTTEERSER